jgi:hypothetical protein
MVLLGHETLEDVQASANMLKALGAPARRLLADSVEHTGVKRKQLSAAAKALEDAGFLFVRDLGTLWDEQFELMPSLAGEEALELLDEMDNRKARPRA